MARKVCVFCGSSDQALAEHLELAEKLGQLLAEHQIEIIYGGGSTGSMGRLAVGALSRGGKVTGVIPQFMVTLEQAKTDLSTLIITSSMAERKAKFFELADTLIALPGGIGTLEEFVETVSLKKLGLYHGEIFLLNTDSFFNSLISFLKLSKSHGFISPQDFAIWKTVETPEQLIAQLI